VPLSRERLEQRGFNQALEIARPLARAWNKPLIIDSCVRTRNTSPQAELPLTQRRVNMRGAFAVRNRRIIENQHVVVVDDVMTTGHTLQELAACLKRHGAARVSNLVLARTPIR
jgi:ComF family protein